MIKVTDMTAEEMQALLRRVGFGRLGCSRDGRPYVVPMHYAYDSQDIFFFTTDGTKTEFIEANPQACLRVEELVDAGRRQSVRVTGPVGRLDEAAEPARAMRLLTERNPTLSQATNETRLDAWGRPDNISIYRLQPSIMDGRRAVGASPPAPARETDAGRPGRLAWP